MKIVVIGRSSSLAAQLARNLCLLGDRVALWPAQGAHGFTGEGRLQFHRLRLKIGEALVGRFRRELPCRRAAEAVDELTSDRFERHGGSSCLRGRHRIRGGPLAA